MADIEYDLDPPFVPYAVRNVVGATFGLGIRHIENDLIVMLQAWTTLEVGDVYECCVGTAKASGTVVKGQENQAFFQLSILRENVPTGYVFPCYATVVRAGSENIISSEPKTWLIKDTRPGGVDKDPGEPFHSELRLHLPADLQKPGFVLTQDRAKEGVVCTLERYPKMRVRDTPEVFWNGFPTTLQLDEDHVNGTKPIEVVIPWDTIKKGGTGQLKIRCRVHDEVFNYSGELQQWSKLVTLESNFDPDLLAAPYFLVDDVESGEVNYDTQATDPFKFEVIVPAILPNGTKVPTGVWVVAKLKGTRADGTQVKETQIAVRSNPGRAAAINVPSETVKNHIGGLLQCFFELRITSATGPKLGTSALASVDVFGTVSDMPPVSVDEANVGLISLNLPSITVRFPDFTPYGADYDVTLLITGVHPGGGMELYEETLLAGAAPPRPRTVLQKDLKRFEGMSNVKIVYRVDDGKDSNDRTFRESEPFFVTLGEPVAELPKPQIKEVDAAGNLDPASVFGGVTVTLLLPNTGVGDNVFWYWTGSGTGGSTGNSQSPIVLNGNTAGKSVKFQVDEKYVKANINRTFSLSYTVVSADGATVSRSAVLEVSVGMALGDLQRPEVLEATTMPDELSPAMTVEGATVRATIPRLAAGDRVRVQWTGLAGFGSYTETKDATGNNIVDCTVPPGVVGANLLQGGRDITVQYFVIRGGKETPSPILKLRLLAIKPIPVPTLENIGDRSVLDINQLTGDERWFIGRWRYIHEAQRMWMKCVGVNKDGSVYLEKIYSNNLVTANGEAQGIMRAASVGALRNLEDGSTLTVSFKVNYDRSSDENNAIEFPSRTYLIQAVPAFNLMFLDGPYAVGPHGRLDTVKLDAGSNVTAAVKVSVTLENGFSFADGTMGTKEFTTDARGKLAITGIRCPGEVGVYSILANTAKSSANAEINVKRLLLAGSFINLRSSAESIALTPDNVYAYVALREVGIVAKVDLSSGGILKEIDVGARVGKVKVSPDGKKVYVSSPDFLVIIGVSEDRIINKISVPGTHAWQTVDFSPAGDYAFVGSYQASSQTSSVVKVDVKTEVVNRTYSLGSQPPFRSLSCLDDQYVYCVNNPLGILYRLNLVSGTTEVVISGTPLSANLLRSNDRKYLYVGHFHRNQIVAIKMPALEQRPIPINVTSVTPVTVNAANTLMVLARFYNESSMLVNANSGALIKDITMVSEVGAVFSPSGKNIYLCDYYGARISVITAF